MFHDSIGDMLTTDTQKQGDIVGAEGLFFHVATSVFGDEKSLRGAGCLGWVVRLNCRLLWF